MSVAGPTAGRSTPIARVPGSMLVTAFPLASGHGTVARSMFDLGGPEHMVFFKIRRQDPEAGYEEVVRPVLPISYASAMLSLYLPGRWSKRVARASWVHFASPHFFHLSRANPRCTGTVHDLIFLDTTTHNARDTPPGTTFFFPRVMRFVDRLAGLVVISHTVDRALKARFPKLSTTVIHHWTRDDFQPRDREASRRALGLPLDKKVLLHVSIDNQRKNLEILPKVMEGLGSDHVLVRIGDSSRIRAQFAPGRLIERNGVEAADYPLYFNAADTLLMPSFDEGFGVPIIEAVNSGLPVLASDIEVFREILRERYPFYADPRRPDAWVEMARQAIETGRPDAGGSKLYAYLGAYYRPARAAEEFRRFYESVGMPVGPAPSMESGGPTPRSA